MLISNTFSNINQIKSLQAQVSFQKRDKTPAFAKNALEEKEAEFLSQNQKVQIFAATAIGMITGLALCGRRQGVNIFKWEEFKNLKIGSLEILGLAVGSLVGGLTGGIAVDKTNKRDKIRESLQQFVGNIAFPLGFVAAGNMAYDAAVKKFDLKPPVFENKIANAISKSAPVVAVTAGSLALGIVVGNKVANLVNNKIFKKDEERKIKMSDLAAHVDDTLLGATLVAQNLAPAQGTLATGYGTASAIGSAASRLIPPALIVPGYVAGTAQ